MTTQTKQKLFLAPKKKAYFITLCTYQQRCLFGEVQASKMQLNRLGQAVQEAWEALSAVDSQVNLGDFIVMPNHLHAILYLKQNANAKAQINVLVNCFKNHLTQHLNLPFGNYNHWNSDLQREYQIAQLRAQPSIWQQNYHQYLIQDSRAYIAKRQYIQDNPRNWQKDYLHQAS